MEKSGWVNLKMQDVNHVERVYADSILNTGSPHYIKPSNDISLIDVFKEGRIFVRTYERGVEAETQSCGTGVTASALVFAHNDNGLNRVDVRTPGGYLAVEFEKYRIRNLKISGYVALQHLYSKVILN